MQYTSYKCFQEITKSGVLPQRREEVYKALAEFGPCTSKELETAMQALQRTTRPFGAWKRLSELQAQGIIRSLDDLRPCRVTGKLSLVWEVVDAMPVPVADRPMSKGERIQTLTAQVEMLTAQVARLEAENKELKSNRQLALF